MLHRRALVLAASALLVPCLALAAPSRDGVTLTGPRAAASFVAPPVVPPPDPPCEGNNYLDDTYFDPAYMGGPLVALEWVPAASVSVTRVEVFTGEVTAPSSLAIWSDDGGAPSQPLAALAVTAPFAVSPANAWYGADLDSAVAVTAGARYWVVWDPAGGEQVSATDNPADIQQTYWGSYDGTVSGGADWFGPFSFPDRRWKFRMFCGSSTCPDADGDGVCDEADLCPGTVAPELAPDLRLGVNRWALVDDDDVFDTTPPNGVGPKATFTLEDTRGCSCIQVIEALGIGDGHEKFGCSTGVMRHWVALNAP